MEETLAGGRKPAGRGGRCGGNPVLSGISVPSVIASAPCRGATKAKAKGKRPSYNTFESVERWIWDTGSGVDVCGKEHAPKDGTGLIRPASEMFFHTANGTVSAGPVYPGLLGPLNEAIAPYILESTPPLLTVGKRCMTKGYGSSGSHGRSPLLSRRTRRSSSWK